MENVLGTVFLLLFLLIGIIIFIGISARIINTFISQEKTVAAIVVDKQCFDMNIYSKKQPPHREMLYVITFLCKNKKIHFNVSSLSYNDYQIKQHGTLTYKGDKIINFKKTG